MVCINSIIKSPELYFSFAFTIGVPDCVYHKKNCFKSLPVLSSKTFIQSSTVIASPSCLLKNNLIASK